MRILEQEEFSVFQLYAYHSSANANSWKHERAHCQIAAQPPPRSMQERSFELARVEALHDDDQIIFRRV
jgi:hypothetical protein